MKHLDLTSGCLQATKVTRSVTTASGRVATAAAAPPPTETPAAAIILACDDADFSVVDVDNCRTVQVIDCVNVDMNFVKWFFAVGECRSVTTTCADVYIATSSDASVKTASGDISLDSCDTAESASGDIHIGHCRTATTASGDIFVKGSCVKARSASGNICARESCDAASTVGIVKRV